MFHGQLIDSAYSSLQASQHDLERQRITDNLKKNLAARPEKGMLVERRSYIFALSHNLLSSFVHLVSYSFIQDLKGFKILGSYCWII